MITADGKSADIGLHVCDAHTAQKVGRSIEGIPSFGVVFCGNPARYVTETGVHLCEEHKELHGGFRYTTIEGY